MADRDYHEKLNQWHLELAIAVDALDFVVHQIEGEGLGACAAVLRRRFRELVDGCPFPVLSPSRGGTS